jgi:hypothetical protein
MSVPHTLRMPLIVVFGGAIVGAYLGWAIAVWIWLCRVPKSYAPTAVSAGTAEFLASLFCLCAIALLFCWRWDFRSRMRLVAFLFGGYVVGLFVAPLRDEAFESQLARIWTYLVFEFHPSWGLAGAVIGAAAFSVCEILVRKSQQRSEADLRPATK